MTKRADDVTKDVTNLARRLAREAAAYLLEGWSKPRTSVETKTTGTDMVSEMDRGAERLIVDGIIAARPNDAILGEEGTAQAGTSGIRWIIDPLDGTTNYLYGLTPWAVSIGVEADGVLFVGVVRAPAIGQEYWAEAGGGAYCNNDPIHVSSCHDVAKALLATGFAYAPDARRRQGETVARVLPSIRDLRRGGSAAIDLCLTAAGRVDAYYESGCNPWDLAAGTLIVREAGGIVTDLDGAEPSASMCIAAPPSLHASLQALLRS